MYDVRDTSRKTLSCETKQKLKMVSLSRTFSSSAQYGAVENIDRHIRKLCFYRYTSSTASSLVTFCSYCMMKIEWCTSPTTEKPPFLAHRCGRGFYFDTAALRYLRGGGRRLIDIACGARGERLQKPPTHSLA